MNQTNTDNYRKITRENGEVFQKEVPGRKMANGSTANRVVLNTGIPNRAASNTGTPNTAVSNTGMSNRAASNTGTPNRAVLNTGTPNRAVSNTGMSNRAASNNEMSNGYKTANERVQKTAYTTERALNNQRVKPVGYPNRKVHTDTPMQQQKKEKSGKGIKHAVIILMTCINIGLICFLGIKIKAVGILDQKFPAFFGGNDPKQKVIMIDAGHGGKDPGTSSGSVIEKDINLTMAKKLKTDLEDLGYRVILTRSDDIFLELEERTALCQKYQPDLFVSLHCNYSESSSGISGYECYYYPENDGGKIASEQIIQYLYEHSQIEIRGGKEQDYYVIKNNDSPAVLMELGYLSNTAECSMLSSDTYQSKLSLDLAKAIDTAYQTIKETDES